MVGILDIASVLTPIIDRVFPDPKDKLALQEQINTLAAQEEQRQHDEVMGQIQVDTAEAGNASVFVSGWRPFVGWVCGAGVAYSFIIEPLAEFIAKLAHYSGQFPTLDVTNLMTLMMGMLGMGYLRTKEKMAGIPDSQPDVGPVAAAPAKPKGHGLWPF
jgi:hypothetical protein